MFTLPLKFQALCCDGDEFWNVKLKIKFTITYTEKVGKQMMC